ncbi:unnamed protein product [Paramecium pentaurelia]|uniref:Transmembrane protein n=1 Tax=Paramecium pentaurelia TaxID=43138 RepID=A0A8S1V8Z2_9CILI|nr:unnamed protein product [Paramecium pentaurelia]
MNYLFIISSLIIYSIFGELILLTNGDHYHEIFDINKHEFYTDCDEKHIYIQEHKVNEQIQMLQKNEIEQILYYPNDQNTILILEKNGKITILFKDNQQFNSPFKELGTFDLNTKNLPYFTCSDMTQYSLDIFMAVCRSNNDIYISKIQCSAEEDKYLSGCSSQLYLDTDQLNNCDNLNIITESSWRVKDPEYFSIYCSSQENFQITKQLLIGKFNNQSNSIKMVKFEGPINEIEKVSFFDDNTLMILDHRSGLHVYRFKFTDDGEVTYEQLLWQLFLPNELFYALSYSHEQYAIRFPPIGIIENDIQYSIVILSDHFIYELALPQQSKDFFFTTLSINDKINIKNILNGKQIKKGQIQYDEQFYYVCLTYIQNSIECYRIDRHQSYTEKLILQNKYQHPMLLTYPVSFSTITGQTNILITQQMNETQAILTLIKNEIERLTIVSTSNEEFLCSIVYKNINNQNVTLTFYNQQFESTNVFKIEHLQNYNFPNTDSTVLYSTLIRGPATILQPKSDKKNVEVISLSGFGYEMWEDLYQHFIQHSRIPIKSFLDKGFRTIFLQIDQVKMIIQQEITNTNYFTQKIYSLDCSSVNIVKNIVSISPYYIIFYQKTTYYTVLKIKRVQEDVVEYDCKNVEYPLYDQQYEVFVDLDYINLFFSTNNTIYYTDIYFKNLITIEIDRRFRQLNFQFLKNDLIIGSHQNKLYQIQLTSQFKANHFKTVITEIELGQMTHNFKFFVLQLKKPILTLVIVDDRITLYTIDNLQDIKFDSLLPQFNSIINANETYINYYMLIVPTNKPNELYVYDLSKTGSDRLHAIHKYSILSEPITICYPKMQTFLYCLQFANADINCYFNKMLEFELIASDPTNIDNQFSVAINAQSALSYSVQKTLTINGSFRYQDTMIEKSVKRLAEIEIYKTNFTTQLKIMDYYSGPIFNYQLQNAKDFNIKMLPFILEQEDNLVRFKIDQIILGTSVSKEYLIILGDETIGIIDIPQTQCKLFNNIDHKQVIQSTIDYDEIKNVFFDQDQPTVNNCTKSFINPLSIAELSAIHIIALFCQSMMVRIDVTNQINQLSFTILSDNQPIEKQFLENFFFLNINFKDFLYQNQSSFILEDVKMINFPIQFKPKYKFITVTAMVKGNKRYDTEDRERDNLICIFYGYLDQNQSSLLNGSLLDVIGASNFNQNTLIVNNFQMYCIKGCAIQDANNIKIDTIIELVFNDQYSFNLFKLQISFIYTTNKQPLYKLINVEILNIKELMSNFVQNQIEFTYIDTEVQFQNESTYTINVTTDSLSFDLVQISGRIEIEQIFKQYTQCQSPPGSLKASYNEYFAISCRNASRNYSEQTQFVKLFLRGQQQINHSVKSVIQAAQIQGNLMLLDIQKGYLNEHVRMLILEQDNNQQDFQLRWFALNDQFTLIADQNSTPKSVLNVQLCPSNLNEIQGLCMDITISNTGYKQYITTEWLLFVFLIGLPLIISCSFIIYCIINYKAEKQKRVESFGMNLEQQLKKQSSHLQLKMEDSIY